MKKVDVLLGLQWGDEGKGKIVDVLTPKYDIIARFQGGPNAGHTLEFDGQKHVLHTIPSGIFHKDTINVIGNGVIIDPNIFKLEIDELRESGAKPEDNLLISKRAHLILPTHRMLDATYEASKGKSKIGSTLKGIGPTYTDKAARVGLRIGDAFAPDFRMRYEKLRDQHIRIMESYGFDFGAHRIDGMLLGEYEAKWFMALDSLRDFRFIDSEIFINESLKEGKSVLAEGAQGTLLDVDFGSYPFVTSSNTICAGVCSGLGVAPQKIGNVYGIFKAYCTRVGSGPFPTELDDKDGELLRDKGHEFGSTTGRSRRCGWLDLPALKYSIMLNGVTHLFMMKADVMDDFEQFKVCTHYKIGDELHEYAGFDSLQRDLTPVLKTFDGWKNSAANNGVIPEKLEAYIRYVEEETGVEVPIVSVGPDRTETIERKKI